MQSALAFGDDVNVMPCEEYAAIMLFRNGVRNRSGQWRSVTVVLSFPFRVVPPLRHCHGVHFVFVSHRVQSSEGLRTYGNDAQTGFGKWSDSCALQSRWTDVPFYQAECHWLAFSLRHGRNKTAENGLEQRRPRLVAPSTGRERFDCQNALGKKECSRFV